MTDVSSVGEQPNTCSLEFFQSIRKEMVNVHGGKIFRA